MSRELSSRAESCLSSLPSTFTVASDHKTQLSTSALLSATHTPRKHSRMVRSQSQLSLAARVDSHREKVTDGVDVDGDFATRSAEKHPWRRRSAQRALSRASMHTESLY